MTRGDARSSPVASAGADATNPAGPELLRRVAALRDHAAALHGPVRDAGLFTASLYVEAACGNAGIALQSAAAEYARSPRQSGLVERVGLVPDVVPRDGAAQDHESLLNPDLGWDLISSPEARALAADDPMAAEMVRGLGYRRWRHVRSLAAWLTTPACAVTLVRFLRDGRPPPRAMVPLPDFQIHPAVIEATGSVGWMPDPFELWA